MYVCMYVCVYVCVCMCIIMFVCMCVYVCMYVCMYVCTVLVEGIINIQGVVTVGNVSGSCIVCALCGSGDRTNGPWSQSDARYLTDLYSDHGDVKACASVLCMGC